MYYDNSELPSTKGITRSKILSPRGYNFELTNITHAQMSDRKIQTPIMDTPVAKTKSLVEWVSCFLSLYEAYNYIDTHTHSQINSFGVSDVNSLEDLSSGHLLLHCMQKV